ncbi:MAG: flavin reductase family protein [Lachnospiraceae bacterium]
MFQIIKPEELQKNPFTMIGKEWLLITAEKDGKANTMTASWGGVGVLWGKNVATLYIRPQRYTKEFVDASDTLSLSVLDESFRKTLNYLGTVSGRDENKIEKAGLTVAHEGDTPYFAEANTVLICKKLYAQDLKPECFLDAASDEKWYPKKDYHTMYICEIEKVLTKQN